MSSLRIRTAPGSKYFEAQRNAESLDEFVATTGYEFAPNTVAHFTDKMINIQKDNNASALGDAKELMKDYIELYPEIWPHG